MKRIFALLCFIIGFGCTETGNYDYEFYVNDVYFEVRPGMNTIETHVFVIEDVPTFLNQYLANVNRNPSDVANIASGRANLMSQYNGVDLGFIKEVRIRVVDKFNPNNYQEIFQRLDIPFTGEYNMALNPTLADIKSYIDDESVNIEVRIKFRRVPPTFIPMQLDFSYAVIL